jgi:hypothetical protein
MSLFSVCLFCVVFFFFFFFCNTLLCLKRVLREVEPSYIEKALLNVIRIQTLVYNYIPTRYLKQVHWVPTQLHAQISNSRNT